MIELADLGYLGLFIGSFLAATIIPFSSEVILSFMLYNNYNLYACLGIATLGNWLGGMTGYYLGLFGKTAWLEKYFRIKHENLVRFQKRIKKYGSIIAFFSWVPVIGDPLGIALGFFKVNLYKVAIFMFIGKLFRYILWGYLFLKGMSFF